ncbi:MAG: V-type ATPase subunit subunit G family protein [Candidatus Aquicultorales bacterium]
MAENKNGDMPSDMATDFQIHKDAIEKGGALDLIREKELSINAKVLEARKQAEDMVADARRKALGIKEKASSEGPEEAKAFLDAEVAKAQKEAETIKASVDSEVKAVTTGGTKNLDKAVGKVLEVVIP